MAKYSSLLLAGSSAKNWEARNVKRRGVRMVVYMLPLPLRDASVIPTLLSDQSVSAISSRTEEASFCFYFPEAVGEHAFDRSERLGGNGCERKPDGAGGVTLSSGELKWLADCLAIFFSSEDWAARKAAAEALGKLATVERNDLSSIRSFVSISFVWMCYFILGYKKNKGYGRGDEQENYEWVGFDSKGW
ncbi:hypothetical protein IGI04_029417 [Brassica rapa subsp. trilocularis]|uniref:Interferon-related developmental regulator N-terminal domain-containing protein n=1 Tax=Brassica rapa subsp. trilocularis TaxID=1813537 RepID=A0ABQ7LRR0_BRACM|nr:hypothetical protein IGI04_029417 [Brassica rapa subsp. trilocularis]